MTSRGRESKPRIQHRASVAESRWVTSGDRGGDKAAPRLGLVLLGLAVVALLAVGLHVLYQ